MLDSLVELQQNLRKQLALTRQKIKSSTSDAEKERLEEERARLDRQLSDSTKDFERIATGVELDLFVEKKSESFSWKDEIAILVEPATRLPRRAGGRGCSPSFHDHIE